VITEQKSDMAVLLIAYRRKDHVKTILEICKRNMVSKIYIALDGAKPGSESGQIDNFEICRLVEEFEKHFSGEVKRLFRDRNVGCAASVLSACDWIFENEESAAILEDDCIPNDDFFDFSRQTLSCMRSDPNIWLSCGTQFSPSSLHYDSWLLSSYALTWGWATTSKNWGSISQAFKLQKAIDKNVSISAWERTYWNQGARRAQSGWVDVWDTILLQQMRVHKKMAILPKFPLVTNVGNDTSATHTHGQSPWLHLDTGGFYKPSASPLISIPNDSWLRRNLFTISSRHIFSTKVTALIDFLKRNRLPMPPLIDRWKLAEKDRLR